MATVSVLLGAPQKGTRIARDITELGSSSAIFLDATLSESFDAPIEVTQHPVEKGVDITDHIILKPQKVTIDGVLSETPFSLEASEAGLASSVAASIGQALGGVLAGALATAALSTSKTMAGLLSAKNISGGTVVDDEADLRDDTIIPSGNARLRDAINEFMFIRNDKKPVTIITGLKQYKDFILIAFNVKRDNKNGQSINVHLEFQEVHYATSQTVRIAVPKTKAAVKKSDQGRKNATPAPKPGSYLKQIVGAFIGK